MPAHLLDLLLNMYVLKSSKLPWENLKSLNYDILNTVSKISLKSFLKIMFEVGPHYKKHSKNRWCNKYYCCLFPFILLFQQLFLILLCYQYVSVCVIIIVESILNPLRWWKLRPCPYPLFFLQIQWLRWEFKLKGSQILFQGLNPYFSLVLNWKRG